MRYEVKMPKLGDTANEVVIIEWCVAVGEAVAEGNPLVTVETDKVDADVPSPVSGTVVAHLVSPGDEVGIGLPIAIIHG